MEASIGTDRCGLNVRREGAAIRLYPGGVFVLERA
jgi:hypothetical protein